MNAKLQPQVISRRAAFTAGLKRYFTGEPCRKGHIAERYVSTGGCLDCASAGFKFRQNAFSHELAPFWSERLWVPRSYSVEELAALEKYLQRCIYEHAKHTAKLTPEVDEALGLQLERMV